MSQMWKCWNVKLCTHFSFHQALPLCPDQLQCDLSAQHLRLRTGEREATRQLSDICGFGLSTIVACKIVVSNACLGLFQMRSFDHDNSGLLGMLLGTLLWQSHLIYAFRRCYFMLLLVSRCWWLFHVPALKLHLPSWPAGGCCSRWRLGVDYCKQDKGDKCWEHSLQSEVEIGWFLDILSSFEIPRNIWRNLSHVQESEDENEGHVSGYKKGSCWALLPLS